MWVFGYGSLMWDGWEQRFSCVQRAHASLAGYCRKYNKASVRNWGTKVSPGPTLNLARSKSGICDGIAFEFSDAQRDEVLGYLKKREGKSFDLEELAIRIESQADVRALVPIYQGENLIEEKTNGEIAEMIATANGTSGKCLDYFNKVAENMDKHGIDDTVVNELRLTLKNKGLDVW